MGLKENAKYRVSADYQFHSEINNSRYVQVSLCHQNYTVQFNRQTVKRDLKLAEEKFKYPSTLAFIMSCPTS